MHMPAVVLVYLHKGNIVPYVNGNVIKHIIKSFCCFWDIRCCHVLSHDRPKTLKESQYDLRETLPTCKVVRIMSYYILLFISTPL